jgi:hypothetical protein
MPAIITLVRIIIARLTLELHFRMRALGVVLSRGLEAGIFDGCRRFESKKWDIHREKQTDPGVFWVLENWLYSINIALVGPGYCLETSLYGDQKIEKGFCQKSYG